MKIAVIGAGFTGLSAALKLSRNNQKVTVFEKERTLGGLAAGFKKKGWHWSLEKHYHHWFTNDQSALSLIKELGFQKDMLIPSPLTSVYFKKRISPFNSPKDVLTFPHLTVPERVRCAIVLAYLKILPVTLALNLEKTTAFKWLPKYFGNNIFNILWKPLFEGKFGPFASGVNMAWFWARIKKRTPKLVYLKGGYQRLLEKMAEEIKKNKGSVKLNTPFKKEKITDFDKIIFTAPSKIFTLLFPRLPPAYKKRLNSIPHLHALNLLLETPDKILENQYWLNINDRSFPFIGVIAHTNFVDKIHYGNKHLTWFANYLPPDHPYTKLTKEKLFKIYFPFIKKINPRFNLQPPTFSLHMFLGPFAQPVVLQNYSKIKPDFKTPVKNVFLANMDMVYPWDRGTNYAIELGFQVADEVLKS